MSGALPTRASGSIADLTGRPEPLIARRILKMLNAQGLVEGDRIPTEEEISRHFGESRQRVREGLRYLESIGILKSRQGSGRVLLGQSSYTLPALLHDEVDRTPTDILNVLAIRQVLEVGFLPTVVETIGPLGLHNLRQAIADMHDQLDAGESFTAQDRVFHEALYAHLDNPLLLGLLAQFWELFQRIDENKFRHTEDADQVVQHHQDILDAIERGDVDAAQYHMRLHFRDVLDILEQLRETGWDASAAIH
jgi:DNA-binding FadR family transcriptional regulator